MQQINLFQQSSELEPLHIENRRYLGSKSRMLDFIDKTIQPYMNDIKSVADIFAGTGVVSDFFSRKYHTKLLINDILHSNYVSYITWFDNHQISLDKIKKYLIQLNNLDSENVEGYVTQNFGGKYFSVENSHKIDAIREQIEKYNDINYREKAFLLTSLLYAMDGVANTVGHYDAYLKQRQVLKPLELKLPMVQTDLQDNQIYRENANLLVRNIKADLVYIDPPYNSRQYGDAYHLLENIIRWHKPKVVGVAKKMENREDVKSKYSTRKAPEAFEDLIQHIQAKYILVSYNNMAKKGNSRSNAKISNQEIIDILTRKGKVEIFNTPFQPFSSGKSHIINHKELLYLCKVKN